jgi:hypothetical protein
VLLLIMTVCAGQAAAREARGGMTLAEINESFSFDGVDLRRPVAQILEQHRDRHQITPQPGAPGVFSVRPATGGAAYWGAAELTDLRWVFRDGTLYAVELDFEGKRNTLAVLDQAVTRFGTRESLRGRFSLNDNHKERAPQELIKEWKGSRVLITMTYWDTLSNGTLRVVDRERFENALQPQREQRDKARNRLSRSVMDLDWGIREQVLYQGEAELPDPGPEDATEGDAPEITPDREERSRLDEQNRGNRWAPAASDLLFD